VELIEKNLIDAERAQTLLARLPKVLRTGVVRPCAARSAQAAFRRDYESIRDRRAR
jgi:hypothetical protein